MAVPAHPEDFDYFIDHGDGYARLCSSDPYRVLAVVRRQDGQWRPMPTDVPMPWEAVDARFATAAEALTALVPYAAAAVGYGSDREMLAVIAATKFKSS